MKAASLIKKGSQMPVCSNPIAEKLINLTSNSEEETFAIGERIAKHLLPGSVIALSGTLGSGKTILTKGIASGLGLTENLTSPTYTIINEYPLPNIKNTLFHIDAYRLNNNKDFEDINGLEIVNSKGICIIEWSCRIKESLPPETINISIEIIDNDIRKIKITGLENL